MTADWHNPAVLAFNETQITSPQNGNVPQFGDSCHTLAAKDHPPVIAIQGDGRTSTGANGNGYKVDGSMYTLNVAFTVVATQDQTLIAPIKNDQTPKLGEVNDPMFTLRRGGQGGTIDCVADVGNYIVRRLTPRECERLQGFPDDWTLIPYRGKPAEECPDTPRYKAMGNSMAVPVMMWLGRRIGEVDRLEHDDRRC